MGVPGGMSPGVVVHDVVVAQQNIVDIPEARRVGVVAGILHSGIVEVGHFVGPGVAGIAALAVNAVAEENTVVGESHELDVASEGVREPDDGLAVAVAEDAVVVGARSRELVWMALRHALRTFVEC